MRAEQEAYWGAGSYERREGRPPEMRGRSFQVIFSDQAQVAMPISARVVGTDKLQKVLDTTFRLGHCAPEGEDIYH